MPNKDGIEATNEIKSFSTIPVIAITTSVVFNLDNPKHDIFDDFIHKPLKKDTLLLSMSKYLKSNTEFLEDNQKQIKIQKDAISLKNYPSLSKLLQNTKVAGDMQMIQKFAYELESYGKKDKVENFKNIATKLSSAIDSFDIEECDLLLGYVYRLIIHLLLKTPLGHQGSPFHLSVLEHVRHKCKLVLLPFYFGTKHLH